MLELFRSTVPIYKDNQAFLPVELKVKPRSVPLTAEGIIEYKGSQMLDTNPFDEGEETKRNDPKHKEPEPIKGFLTKEQLRCFFVDRKKK